MIWSQVVAVAFAGCAEPSINADLHETLGAANAAYVAFDETGFTRHVETLESQAVCLSEVIAPSYAAALHRVRGMGAFLGKDYGNAELHFAASRRIEPSYRFPESIAPSGNPMLDRFTAVQLDATSIEAVQAPAVGSYRLDGLASLQRDPRLPVVLQRVTPRGVVQSTELLLPEATLPPGEKIKDKRRAPLLVAGIASLVASAGLYGGAMLSKSAFEEARAAKDLQRIQRSFRTNRGLVVGSAALGAAGVGLVTGHFLFK